MDPQEEAKIDPQSILGGSLRQRVGAYPREVCDGSGGPNRVQYTLRENEKDVVGV